MTITPSPSNGRSHDSPSASHPRRRLSSSGRGWAGIEVARFTGYDEISIPPLPKHHAIIHLNRRPLGLTQRLDGKINKEPVHRGEVAIIPGGRAWEWGFTGETESDLLPLCLEDDFLREVARSVDVDPDRVEILPLLGTRDPQIERIAPRRGESRRKLRVDDGRRSDRRGASLTPRWDETDAARKVSPHST